MRWQIQRSFSDWGQRSSSTAGDLASEVSSYNDLFHVGLTLQLAVDREAFCVGSMMATIPGCRISSNLEPSPPMLSVYQLPRSPNIAMTRANRSAPFSQFTSRPRSILLPSPATKAEMILLCSSTER